MSLTNTTRDGNVTVTMEDRVEAAARRTAINLMRLNEALEVRDAAHLSEIRHNGRSARYHRLSQLKSFYKKWFTSVAGGLEQGRPRQRGPANPAAEGSDPSETKEDS